MKSFFVALSTISFFSFKQTLDAVTALDGKPITKISRPTSRFSYIFELIFSFQFGLISNCVLNLTVLKRMNEVNLHKVIKYKPLR